MLLNKDDDNPAAFSAMIVDVRMLKLQATFPPIDGRVLTKLVDINLNFGVRDVPNDIHYPFTYHMVIVLLPAMA